VIRLGLDSSSSVQYFSRSNNSNSKGRPYLKNQIHQRPAYGNNISTKLQLNTIKNPNKDQCVNCGDDKPSSY